MQFNAQKMRDYIDEDSFLVETLNNLKNKMTEVQALEFIFNYSCACCRKVAENVIECSHGNSKKTFKLCEDCLSYVNGY
ncbi:MAG: hypothetical protein Q8934_22010 [Bacillota bacterium]|nr:hypothetical protein [Bacillota bacterium]